MDEQDRTPSFDFDTPSHAESTPTPEDIIRDQALEALRTVFDPEIPVNIVELGLIYDLTVEPDHKVLVEMTLTSPGCPVAGAMPGQVQDVVAQVPGVTSAEVNLVWEPPWDPSRMTEEARLELGMM